MYDDRGDEKNDNVLESCSSCRKLVKCLTMRTVCMWNVVRGFNGDELSKLKHGSVWSGSCSVNCKTEVSPSFQVNLCVQTECKMNFSRCDLWILKMPLCTTGIRDRERDLWYATFNCFYSFSFSFSHAYSHAGRFDSSVVTLALHVSPLCPVSANLSSPYTF